MGDRGTGRGRGVARGRGKRQEQAGPPPSVGVQPQGAWARRPGMPQQQQQPPPQQPPPQQPPPQQPTARLPQQYQPVGAQQQPAARPQQQYQPARAPQQPAAPRPAMQQPPPPDLQSAGRASRIGDRGEAPPGDGLSEQMSQVSIAGGGGDSISAGRGNMRGRRVVGSEILITRPSGLVSKQGKSGTGVKLYANYFKMLSTTDWCLYQYRVDLSPEEDRTIVRKGLVRLHKEILGAYIFDGTVMYTSQRLQEPLELFSTRQSDGQVIKINIRLVGDMVKGDYHYLQFFNIIMRKCLGNLQLQLVGRDYYDALAKVEVREHKLELWPGYLTSIRQHEQDILMCSEITHKVMRQQTLLHILNDCYERYQRDYKQRFSAQVIGLVVLTGYNNNTYRIDDVDYDVNPMSTFKLRTGEDISYKDYYRNKYQINIRQDSQPMLVSRSKPRERRAGQAELVYLVPELCRATGLTDDMRADFHLMRALASHTRIGPDHRIQKLLAFNQRLRSEPKVMADLAEWNLDLDKNLVEIPGRKLPVEAIIFGQGKKESAGEQADWTRSFRSNEMLNTGKLTDWVFVVMNRTKRDAQSFLTTLIKAAAGMRFQIAQPRFYEINDDRSDTYMNALEQIMSKVNPQLIFCMVSNNRADRYAAIKKKCCVDRPVPTQVMLAKNTTSKGVMSIATKVAIQLNCKIGGSPWTVDIPLTGLMVVGFDVCHDTNSKGRDFGAMVASMDRTFGRYYNAVSAHSSGEELSNDLSLNLIKALHKYKEINQALPQRIVIYRDGVGEGQIPYVHQHEVELIKSKLAQVYGPQNPAKMAFIIVTKRINTRIFKGKMNPDPGTVVDNVITDPNKYDFFIVSQWVREGTVSPTSYSVISDTVALDADKLQRLTYKLTHMYYNWSGTVRVPAPCQYAHKLAFLVAQSIHRPPSQQLEDSLFYL